jgi:hypothetical protein
LQATQPESNRVRFSSPPPFAGACARIIR